MKKTILSILILLSDILLSQSTQWLTFNSVNSRLPNNSIYSVVVDQQGVKWIGTDGYGLARFDGTNWTTYNSGNSGLSNNSVRVIYVDEENNKWIGTRNGGLYRFDGTNWTNWNMTNSILPSNWVASFVIDPRGVKWIGTGDKGLVRFEGDNWFVFNSSNSPLPVNYVYALAADTLGNIWIGTNGGGTARFDGLHWEIKNKYNSGLSCNASLSIAIDNQNDKWIASYSCGLFRLHDTTFTKFDKHRTPLHDNWVYSVTIDKDQAKWLGMDSTGVAKFSGSQWTIYDTANSGLADKHVRSIAIDNLGNKWIGTYLGGLSVFNENGVNIPPIIIVTEPSNGTNWIAGSKQKVKWSASNIPGNVNIKLSTDGGSSFTVDLITNTANDGSEDIIVPSEISSSSCRIRIESISKPEITGLTGGRFSIVAMTVPIQLKPANNSVKQPLSIKLSWRKGEWCERYKLMVASDTLFLNTFIQDSTITDSLKEIKGLTDFRQYYWKVQGMNLDVRTKWSPVWNFKTMFNSPDSLKASAVSKNKIKLTWNDNSESETGYLIERKSESGFSVLDTAQSNSTSYLDSSITAQGSYQYRVKAIASDGESEYSNIASAEITKVNDPASAVTEFALVQNYPNPFNPATIISYSIPQGMNVKIKVYDMLGKEIAALVDEYKPAGKHLVQFNAGSLTSGMYIYTIQAGEYRDSKKLLILK